MYILSRTVLGSAFTPLSMIGKIEHMEKFGLEHIPKEEGGITTSGLGKAALLAGALVAAGGAYEHHHDAVLEAQTLEHSQTIEHTAGLPARENIPLEAFSAVDEYKSILGDTWSLRSVPGSDSEQDRMQAAIATKHGVSVKDFAQAFEWKLRDAGM